MQLGWRNSVYSLLACLSTYRETSGLYRKYMRLHCTLSLDGYLTVPPFTVIIPLTDSRHTPSDLTLLSEHYDSRACMQTNLLGTRTRYTHVSKVIDNK